MGKSSRRSLNSLLRVPDEAKSVTYDIVVPCSAASAQSHFTQVVWYDLGFQTMPLLNMLPFAGIHKVGDENGVGCVRVVPGAWLPMIKEEILAVEPGKINYRVKSGPFPVSYHKGTVLFEEEGDSTRVTWTVEYVPFPLCDGVTRFLVWFMFPNGLKALEKAILEDKNE